MHWIVLIDTSIYLNVLAIPGYDQHRSSVHADFERKIDKRCHFLLPMATIWETGNHIARLADGRLRRKHARHFIDNINKALKGDVPYTPTYFPERETFLEWLDAFPDYAQRNKSDSKTREGTSLADLSLIKEWERTCAHHPNARVMIWSLDSDLEGYDRAAG